jgi:hypothetical protein
VGCDGAAALKLEGDTERCCGSDAVLGEVAGQDREEEGGLMGGTLRNGGGGECTRAEEVECVEMWGGIGRGGGEGGGGGDVVMHEASQGLEQGALLHGAAGAAAAVTAINARTGPPPPPPPPAAAAAATPAAAVEAGISERYDKDGNSVELERETDLDRGPFVYGVLLMPVQSTVMGAFPLNGTYFQVQTERRSWVQLLCKQKGSMFAC